MQTRRLAIRLLAFGCSLVCLLGQSPAPTLKKADIDRMMTELSNWGRWGKEDQLGALNLITDATRKRAVALVRSGVSVSLARQAEKNQAEDNTSPFGYTMLEREADSPYNSDAYQVAYHGYGHTHIDALCHIIYRGKMFNGFPASEVTRQGAGKLSVMSMRDGILGRGILMDIPELKGTAYLETDVAIYPQDLEAWEKKANIHIGAGDIVLIRTGRWKRRDEKGPWDVGRRSAGLHASCMRWLKQRDAAILGSDAASDVIPSLVDGVRQPVHQLAIVAMGMPIFDNCDLERVSQLAKKMNRWEFMVMAAPLPVEGGTGSPFNPIATF